MASIWSHVLPGSRDSLWRDSCRLSLASETGLSSPPQELAVPIRVFLTHLPPRSCLPWWHSTGHCCQLACRGTRVALRAVCIWVQFSIIIIDSWAVGRVRSSHVST